MTDWLSTLRPGDEVGVSGNGPYGDSLSRVERMTATQIILGRGNRFNRKSGRQIGYIGFDVPRLIEPTDELRLTILCEFCVCGYRKSRGKSTDSKP